MRSCRYKFIPTTKRRATPAILGKTECWYVAHAQPGAQIALGLKPGVTRSQFEEAIHQQRAEELELDQRLSRRNDLRRWWNGAHARARFDHRGNSAAIGHNVSFIDYGRPRELHLQAGLASLKEKVASGKVIRPAPTTMNGTKNRRSPLVMSPFFVVEMFN